MKESAAFIAGAKQGVQAANAQKGLSIQGKVSKDRVRERVAPGFSSCCFTEIDVPKDLRWVSQGISDCCKGCQDTCCI